MQKKEAFFVSENELLKLIRTHYGHDYSIQADQECGNYVHKVFEVPDRWADSDDEADRWEFKKTGDQGDVSTSALLDGLHTAGLLEAGTYVIDMSW